MYRVPREERLKQRILEVCSLGATCLLYLRESEIAYVESLGVKVVKTSFHNAAGDMVVCQIIPHS